MKENLDPEAATVADVERLLREISVIVKRKGREILEEFPITPPQFTALLWLNDAGSLTVGELSQKMYLACSTITDLVDRMEKNHLVKRVRDVNDRRVVHVQLLPQGSSLIEEVMAARRAYLAKILSRFSQEETLAIQKHLALLYEEMKE